MVRFGGILSDVQMDTSTEVDAKLTTKVQIGADIGGTPSSPEVKSRAVTATIGKTTGDFPVSNYTATTAKSAFDLALEAALVASDKVLIRSSSTPYTMRKSISAADNKTIEGENEKSVILQMENARNVSIVSSGEPTGMITNFAMRNLTLDQNGANQTAGGGIVIAGLQDSIFENLTLPVSFRFQILIQGQSNVSNKTGTVTFTNGTEILTGTGTLFSTELSIGDIIKEPTTGEIGRVAAILSNTQLRMNHPWSFATQTGVTYKRIDANSGNKFTNVKCYGTLDDRDNIGLGYCDYAVLTRCYSANASGAGCGFVPDHAKGIRFTDCLAANNGNAGFSYETCEDIMTTGCVSYGAKTGNGFQLISGGENNKFTNCTAFNNFQHGYAVNYNNATFPVPTRNTFSNITAYENGGYGMRVDGATKTYVKGELFNNNTGGYIQNTANSITPTDSILDHIRCYDNRITKQQQRGIWLVTGTNTRVDFPQSSAADHTTAGITDSATNTTIVTTKNGNFGVNNNDPANRFNVNTPTTPVAGRDALYTSSSATSVPFAIQAAPSQTGNLMEFMSSAGNNFMIVTSGGLLRTTTSSYTTPAFSFATEGGTGMGRLAGSANTLFLSTAANMRVQIDTNKTTFTHGMQYSRTPVGNVDYTILPSDYLIAYTSLNASRTVTLPSAVGEIGKVHILMDETGTAATYNLILDGAGTETIDGALTYTINQNYGFVAVYSNGTNWKTLWTSATASGLSNPMTTRGDIIYAETSGTPSRLAGAATGVALVSGGATAPPSWAKIGLATHVNGTLSVGNGGTGRNTSTTAYGILAAGTTAAGVQQTISPGNTGQILKSAGSSALATFSDGSPADVGLGGPSATPTNFGTSIFHVLSTGSAFIGNSSEPSTPVNGGYLYVESGTLKYKGPSGLVTIIAVA